MTQNGKLLKPFAKLLPPLSTEEMRALRTRIAAEDGVHDPVLISEDHEILDGHNRLKIEPAAPQKVITGSGQWTQAEKQAFVVRCNLARRNLSPEQRKQVLGTCNRIAGELKAEGKSQAQVAKMLGVARETVRDWLEPSGHIGGAANMSTDCRQKLSGAQKAAAARRVEEGESQEQVAADFKVATKTIQRTVKKEQAQAEQRQQREEAAKQIVSDCGIHHGDFRETDLVADGSVDLILTDPPYNEAATTLYADLARFAARVLRPGGWCLAYSGQAFLPQVLAGMAEHLTYGWTFAIRHTGGELRFRKLKLHNAWKPIVGFYKPPLDAWWNWFSDMATGGKEKSEHEWQQAEEEAAHFIGALTVADALVVDPFCGSGTVPAASRKLGRKWIGFDIDKDSVESARVRVTAE
jgi:site-specific DNA-methyltransferase (adenine-specific)